MYIGMYQGDYKEYSHLTVLIYSLTHEICTFCKYSLILDVIEFNLVMK